MVAQSQIARPSFNRSHITFLTLVSLSFILLFAPLFSTAAQAAEKWNDIASEVVTAIDKSVEQAQANDLEAAKATLKTARYDVFAGKGLETQIGSQLSGSDVNRINMDFGLLNKAVSDGDADAVAKISERLKDQIEQAGTALGGGDGAGTPEQISPGKWGQTASTMVEILDQAQQLYDSGDAEAAKDKVNEAYYGHYETSGFEKMTMARISGSRVASIELEFALTKRAMSEGKDQEVSDRIAQLKPDLITDANTLDGFDGTNPDAEGGSKTSGTGILLAAFTVILREGMEAMLVVAAVVAYLVKAGHRDKTKVVWIGAGAALVVSGLLAVAISQLTSLAGKSQELIEGITALVAVAMLVYVSNWMLGKSDAAAWDKFIKDKTDSSLSRGSLLSLAFVAFLAVVREGAETILFFQPILAMAEGETGYVWAGIVVGLAALVLVYVVIRFLSIQIPLRPFFLITSLLLAVMALTFTGSGIRELQEADVVSVTPIPGLPTIDLLGFFPRVENLTAQAVVLIVMIALFVLASKRKRKEAKAQ
ncbi:MAG: FTR1 family protein [Actinomycetaceae bacterium]|nr:FTR1 family protein [Actinomycetaceae bacterium]